MSLLRFLADFLLKEVFEGGSHGRSFHRRSFKVKTQSGITHGLSGSGTEATDTDILLLEAGEVLQQGVDSGRTEEEEHVIVKLLIRSEIIRNSAIHHGLRVVDTVLIEDARILLMHVGDDVEETFLLMLHEEREKAVELACLAVENLAFAIYDVFLQIEGYGLGGAEVFHCVGHVDSHLFAETEKIVSSRLGREDDRREVGQIDTLLAEIARAQAFNFDKRTKNDIDAVLARHVEVWGFVGSGFRLRNQYFFNSHEYSLKIYRLLTHEEQNKRTK